MPDFETPGVTQRATIIGRTGSGKTSAGLWLLSLRDDSIPWVIVDYKFDSTLALINYVPLKSKLDRGEVYVIHPRTDNIGTDKILWALWERGNVGIMFDEGYMLPSGGAVDAILTQGRSKHIPVIALSQRPVKISRFFFTEADFIQTFWLTDKRDRKLVMEFTDERCSQKLTDYKSYFYNVAKDNAYILEPVPSAEESAGRINAALDNLRDTLPDSGQLASRRTLRAI